MNSVATGDQLNPQPVSPSWTEHGAKSSNPQSCRGLPADQPPSEATYQSSHGHTEDPFVTSQIPRDAGIVPGSRRRRPSAYFVFNRTLFPSHPSATQFLHALRLPGHGSLPVPLEECPCPCGLYLAMHPISLTEKARVLAVSRPSGPPLGL